MKKALKATVIVAAAVTFMAGTALAAPGYNYMATAPIINVNYNITPIEETGQTGRVAWEKGVVEAVGTGLAPANARYFAEATALARRAAIVDAQRNLVEAIQGMQVDAETTMNNLAIQSDIVKTKVVGLLRGAKIIRQQGMADGSYQVVMTINLYGNDGLAGIALPALQTAPIQQLPVPAAGYTVPVMNAEYTGVIIDARGLGLESTFSPRIYDETGRIVYGNMYIDTDFAISQGMVEYAITPEMAQAAESGQSRAGARPLIIKATRVTGASNCNVVISNTDANIILAYNQNAGFLQKCAVVFER